MQGPKYDKNELKVKLEELQRLFPNTPILGRFVAFSRFGEKDFLQTTWRNQ